MKRWFSRLLQAIEAVATELHGLRTDVADAPEEVSALEARVADLERSQANWKAECEGLLLRAENKHKATRAAEERTRRLAESAGVDEEGLADLPPHIRTLYTGDGGGGEEEGVPPMSEDVEEAGRSLSPFEAAVAAKIGRH